MSDQTHEVDVISVRISSTSNRVRVVAEVRPDVHVEGRARISDDAGRTTVDQVRSPVVVRVPVGTDVVVGTTSGRVEILGTVGALAVVSTSGRVEVARARTVDVRTESGRIEVGSISENARIRTKSGRVQVEAAGDTDVSTRSSRIELKRVSGTVRAHCISGRIEIEQVVANDIDAETVSGRIEVRLPSGTSAYRPAEASGTTTRPDGYDCTVLARSVTGRVEVA